MSRAHSPVRHLAFGVYVIIGLQVSGSLIWLFIVYTALTAGVVVPLGMSDERRTLLIGAILLVGALQLISALGLLLRRRWGWLLTMLITGASMVVGLLTYWNGNPNYPGMLMNIAVVFYLNQRDVQQTFGHFPAGLEYERQ